jgi:hypothetical protein
MLRESVSNLQRIQIRVFYFILIQIVVFLPNFVRGT